MFRTAELGRTLSKEEFHQSASDLRAGLLQVQQTLRQAPFPVIVVFAGVDKAGKSETVNLINEWMDPRWLITRAYGAPSDEMAERPEYWRYWRDLPPNGRIGLFLSCWYSRPVLDRVHGRTNDAEFDEALDRIIAFEQCLADDDVLILKFWMHLGRDAQKERLKKLESDPADPLAGQPDRLGPLAPLRCVRRRRRTGDQADIHRQGGVAHRRGVR